MIKGGILSILGMILLNVSLLSCALQAIAVLVQSIRYNMFVFFGGWDWLSWSLIGVGAAVVLILAGFISVWLDD